MVADFEQFLDGSNTSKAFVKVGKGTHGCGQTKSLELGFTVLGFWPMAYRIILSTASNWWCNGQRTLRRACLGVIKWLAMIWGVKEGIELTGHAVVQDGDHSVAVPAMQNSSWVDVLWKI